MSKSSQMSIGKCYLSLQENDELYLCKSSFFQDKSIKIQKNSSFNSSSQINKNPNSNQNIPNFNLKICLTLKFNVSLKITYVQALKVQMIQILLQNRINHERIKQYVDNNSQNYKKLYDYFKSSCFIKGFDEYFTFDKVSKNKQQNFIVQQKKTLRNRMVKKFSKNDFDISLEDDVFKEIYLQKKVECQNVMSHYGYFEDDMNFYLVYEEMPLKNLRQFLADSRLIDRTLTKKIMKQMLEALLEMQIRGILHNNIRMSSIKIVEVNNGQQQRFCLDQFSAAVYLNELKNTDQILNKLYGYSAPQVISSTINKISSKSDVFMLGAVFFQLLVQKPLFDIKLLKENPHFIGNYPKIEFHFNQINRVSFQGTFLLILAKQLLMRMLEFNPEKRISVIDALTHRFFTTYQSLEFKPIIKNYSNSTFNKTRHFNDKNQQTNRLNEQIQTYKFVQSKTLQVPVTLDERENMQKIYQTIGGSAQQKRRKNKFCQLYKKRRQILRNQSLDGEIDPDEIDDSHMDLAPKTACFMAPSYQQKKSKRSLNII